MRRREFIALMGAAAWPFAAMAQQAGRTYRLGCLLAGPPNDYVAFFDGLRRRGFIEGQNLTVEYRAYGQHVGLIPQYAAELVKARVDVIGVAGEEAIRALQQATKTIPIVAIGGDLLGSGFVNSLSRPDGNTTGVSFFGFEAEGKRQDILIEAVPGLRLMAVLIDVSYTKTAKLDALQDAARKHNVEFSIHRVARGEEDLPSYRQCAGIGGHRAKPCGVTALLCSSAPHYGARRRRAPADDL
jgi:putative tryptophan/tyrosine transport system substrate-binding protein